VQSAIAANVRLLILSIFAILECPRCERAIRVNNVRDGLGYTAREVGVLDSQRLILSQAGSAELGTVGVTRLLMRKNGPAVTLDRTAS
jgi:hypothetical protein